MAAVSTQKVGITRYELGAILGHRVDALRFAVARDKTLSDHQTAFNSIVEAFDRTWRVDRGVEFLSAAHALSVHKMLIEIGKDINRAVPYVVESEPSQFADQIELCRKHLLWMKEKQPPQNTSAGLPFNLWPLSHLFSEIDQLKEAVKLDKKLYTHKFKFNEILDHIYIEDSTGHLRPGRTLSITNWQKLKIKIFDLYEIGKDLGLEPSSKTASEFVNPELELVPNFEKMRSSIPDEFTELRKKVGENPSDKRLKEQFRMIDSIKESCSRLKERAKLGQPPVRFLDWNPRSLQETSITWKELIAAEERNLKVIKDFAISIMKV